jgi:DNA modification methylase
MCIRDSFTTMKKDELVALLTEIADTTTVWDEKRDPPSSYIHPTQKPTSLVRRAMRHSTLPRDATVDLFAGSGSTMIGGQLQGRQTYNIELEPGFCDAIIQRYVETFEECLLFRNGQEIDPAGFRLNP